MEKIKVKLANRVLTVPAEDKDKYLQQGYTIYDMDGKEIATPATDANKVKEANAKIAELSNQLADAEKAASKSAKSAGKTKEE